jgi:hypothetical protein
MTLDGAGNVGIGTTSPSAKLYVDDDGSVISNVVAAFGNSSISRWDIRNAGNPTSRRILSGYVGSSENIRFDPISGGASYFNSGNLLVGTTTDAGYKLDVNGTGRFSGSVQEMLYATSSITSGTVFRLSNTSTGGGDFRFYSTGSGNGEGAGRLVLNFNGSSALLNISGSTGAATFSSSVTATSIIRSGGTSSQYLMADGSVSTLTNPVTGTGSGTTNTIPKFTGANALGNSIITDSGSLVSIDGNFRIRNSNGFNDSVNFDRTAINGLILNSSGNLILNGSTGSSRITCYGDGYFSGGVQTGLTTGASSSSIWLLGEARGGTVTTNATVRVEIGGVLVDLVARYV